MKNDNNPPRRLATWTALLGSLASVLANLDVLLQHLHHWLCLILGC